MVFIHITTQNIMRQVARDVGGGGGGGMGDKCIICTVSFRFVVTPCVYLN